MIFKFFYFLFFKKICSNFGILIDLNDVEIIFKKIKSGGIWMVRDVRLWGQQPNPEFDWRIIEIMAHARACGVMCVITGLGRQRLKFVSLREVRCKLESYWMRSNVKLKLYWMFCFLKIDRKLTLKSATSTFYWLAPVRSIDVKFCGLVDDPMVYLYTKF